MPSPKRAVVAGAGLFGAAAAHELVRRGWQVRVVDPSPPLAPGRPGATSDISKAVRVDYGADRLYTELGQEAVRGWRRWTAELPHAGPPLFEETGVAFLSGSPMASGGFEGDSFEVLRELGHQPRRVSGLPPFAAQRFVDGYVNPVGGWCRSAATATALLEDAGLVVEERSFGGRQDDEVVVLALGAWTPNWMPELADRMWATAHPVVHFDAGPALAGLRGLPVWAADISTLGWYGFPAMEDGTFKVARHCEGRRVHPSDRGQVGDDEVLEFRAFLRGALPQMADAPELGRRRCVYCDTYDGNFWIGAPPERPGLVVAAGGSGHGAKFAPVLGRYVADAVEGLPPRDDAARRFAWRQLGDRAREAARSEA